MFNQLNSWSTNHRKLQKKKKEDHTPKCADIGEQRLMNTSISQSKNFTPYYTLLVEGNVNFITDFTGSRGRRSVMKFCLICL